jgi:hypothetical protein
VGGCWGAGLTDCAGGAARDGRPTTSFDGTAGAAGALGSLVVCGLDRAAISTTGFCHAPVSQHAPAAATAKTPTTAITVKAHRRRSLGSMLGSSRIDIRAADSCERRSVIAST